ncbi:MAG: hypothetical protein JWQ11_4925 [Rhizobacter sp.]|nr:hypothetical protein [Rhizobacter sp.]
MQATVDLASCRRRLGHLLRALFDVEPELLAIEQSIATTCPFLSNLGIHLPASSRALQGVQAERWYVAAATHAAAHQLYSRHQFEIGSLKPIQTALVGVLEDARVERLASRRLPGLGSLWRTFHFAGPEHGGSFVVLLLRLARVLSDSGLVDAHPWVEKGRRLFEEAWAAECVRCDDASAGIGAPSFIGLAPSTVREIASLLGNDIGQMRLQFNAREYVVEPAYRDDNAQLWAPETPPLGEMLDVADDLPTPHEIAAAPVQRTRHTSVNGTEPEDVAPSWSIDKEDGAAALARHRYHEWDRLVRGYRLEWATVIESRPRLAEPEMLRRFQGDHGDLVARLCRLLARSRRHDRVRLRSQRHGDELDLAAAVRSMIDRRCGQVPDDPSWLRVDRPSRQASALLLLDSSASTGAPVDTDGRTVLDVIREAALLTGMVLEQAGDRCAIQGFASNGRHEVIVDGYKRFGQPLDDAALARLAGMRSRLSTRFGAALRHGTRALAAERSGQRLLVLVTDGEPHDVDIFDRRYLIEDARRAVQEATRLRVGVFCVAISAASNAYLADIFGSGGYAVIDGVERLPDVLPALVTRLAGS